MGSVSSFVRARHVGGSTRRAPERHGRHSRGAALRRAGRLVYLQGFFQLGSGKPHLRAHFHGLPLLALVPAVDDLSSGASKWALVFVGIGLGAAVAALFQVTRWLHLCGATRAPVADPCARLRFCACLAAVHPLSGQPAQPPALAPRPTRSRTPSTLWVSVWHVACACSCCRRCCARCAGMGAGGDVASPRM